MNLQVHFAHVTLLCDIVDEIPCWLLTNTACGKYNILKEQPKSISSVPFFGGNVISSLGQFQLPYPLLCALDRFLDLSHHFFDLSLSCKRLMSKATAKMHSGEFHTNLLQFQSLNFTKLFLNTCTNKSTLVPSSGKTWFARSTKINFKEGKESRNLKA